jgi:hypothetical protein
MPASVKKITKSFQFQKELDVTIPGAIMLDKLLKKLYDRLHLTYGKHEWSIPVTITDNLEDKLRRVRFDTMQFEKVIFTIITPTGDNHIVVTTKGALELTFPIAGKDNVQSPS